MAEIRIDLPSIIGKGYGAFWKCRKRYRVVKGGKASKKSTTAALWFIVNMMKPQYKDANLLVVRNVFNTHFTSTFAQLKWAINRLGVSNYWKATIAPLELRYLPTGQRIIFRGFDDVDKLASTTVDKGFLCWVWIEEAFEIQSEADFDRLDLSVPRGNVPAPLFKQTTLTFNPWSEKHWLKRRFFDHPDKDVFSTTTTYLCNEFLDETDHAIYEKMREDNPRKYAVAGLGEWGISEGLVYNRWKVESFDIQEILNSDNGWKFHVGRGLDFGWNDPTAYIALAANPIDKVLYIFDEYYKSKLLCNQIHAMLAEKGVTREKIIADCQAKQTIEELRSLGISRITGSRKGADSIMKGIDLLQQYLIIIHSSCQNTIAEISSYIFDKKNDSIINQPVDKNNHLMDAMRYAMDDMRFFRPQKSGIKKVIHTFSNYMGAGLTAADFKGGWG